MPDEEKTEEKALCPCCGQPTLKKPVKVDGKIVDDYMASIITGEPFSHTFRLFDGKLCVTAGAVTREDGLKLYQFAFMMDPFSSDSVEMKDLIGLVNTYCIIHRIVVTSPKGEHVYMPSKHVIESCDKLVKDWEDKNLQDEDTKKTFLADVAKLYRYLSDTKIVSSTPPMILNRVINDFRGLETILLEAGFDENFWKGIELT